MREGDPECREIVLQAINQDLIAFPDADRDAPAKPLRVEDGHERRKLLEWPLCGVADRKSLCSNFGANSVIRRVNCEVIA